MEWRWELLDEQLRPMAAPEGFCDDQRFGSQSDAESWLGEQWPALFEAGVAAVTLRHAEQPVYGPMPLHPPR